MTDNNTPNTTQQAGTQPEGNGTAGKVFTQEEVNSIVKDRLARERAKGQTSDTTDDSSAKLDAEKAQLEADRQKLQDDRNAFECERYCKRKRHRHQAGGAHRQQRPGRVQEESGIPAQRLC